MPSVLITGVGIVSPIGIGAEAVWRSIQQGQTGIRPIEQLERIGWLAPFGGEVTDFEPKAYVQPRKSLKVMARETQMAFAAGEMAWKDAGLMDAELDPGRVGVVGGAGLQYCGLDEMAGPITESIDSRGEFDLVRWGDAGLRQLFPLWMLKYLPNMAACHIGIRRQAFGPTNTISLGDVSSLVALGEGLGAIERGAADVMIVGGASTRLDLTDLVFHAGAGLSRNADNPAGACRPFDAGRDGSVCGEGAAFLVLESSDHAERRGFTQRGGTPWGTLLSVANRTESAINRLLPTGRSIAAAAQASLDKAGVNKDRLAMVKAHGSSREETDPIEAEAIERVVGTTPVTAPTSYIGSLGAAGGAVELVTALVAWREGVVPATLNYQTPDPACPVNASAEHRPSEGDAMMALSYSLSGQAVAAVIQRA